MEDLQFTQQLNRYSVVERDWPRDLGLPEEKVRVVTLYKGGGFGNRISSMNYDLIAALLSRKTSKPVMVVYRRSSRISRQFMEDGQVRRNYE